MPRANPNKRWRTKKKADASKARPSRTMTLAAIKPPSKTGKRVLFGGCGCLLLMLFGFAFLSNLGDVLHHFYQKPVETTLAGLAAVFLCIPYGFVILWLDRNERQPVYLLAAAFLWGAVFSTFVSVLVNTSFGTFALSIVGDAAQAKQLTASFSAPPIEESTKALAVLVIFLGFPQHFNNILDGIIYGAMAGLGFAVYENWLYYVQTPDLNTMHQLVWMRGVANGLGGSHATYSALFGACLGAFRVLRSGTTRWFLPLIGLALAMGVHFSWNSFAGLVMTLVSNALGDQSSNTLIIRLPIAILILQTPFLLLIFLATFLSLRNEDELIRTYLTTEDPELVSPDEIKHIVPARRRNLHTLKLLLTFQLSAYTQARRRNHLLIKLAFQKWHMDQEANRGAHNQAQQHATRVLELRQQLQQTPRGKP